MTGALVIEVRGKARPAGSKRGFQRGGRVVIVDAAADKGWRAHIQDAALSAIDADGIQRECLPVWPSGPVILDVYEYRVRPQSHIGKRGLTAEGRNSLYPTSAPDRTKIARAAEDALSGIVFGDDSQIIEGCIGRRWGPAPLLVLIACRADDPAGLYRRHVAIFDLKNAEKRWAAAGGRR